MAKDVADMRKEYSAKGLDEIDMPKEPMKLFQQWFDEACSSKMHEPNAMCLSTADGTGRPSARIVLLKKFDDRGFVWYTNYESRKSDDLTVNPNACLTFWWGELERQIRIEGAVEKVSAQESDAYFNSRPKGSQIGAWTSDQSRPVADRTALEDKETTLKAKYESQEVVQRPPHWGGWRISPTYVEFWKGRQSRLHDRLAYTRESGAKNWKMERLQP